MGVVEAVVAAKALRHAERIRGPFQKLREWQSEQF
jgi:hypothetical protein